MATVLLLVGGLWIFLGVAALWGAWFGQLPRLDLPAGSTPPEKLMIQLLVATAGSVELIISILLLSLGLLFISMGIAR